MGAAELKQETYLPEVDESELERISELLAGDETAGEANVGSPRLLIGSGSGEQVELPGEFSRVLRQVVEAMRHGLAVTVAPRSQLLTTQQSAELLGVSRPTLIRLLDEGCIAYERVGSHRRIALRDVLAYRERRRQEQYRALEATAVAIDDEEDIESTLVKLREARKHVAASRRRQ